LAAYPDVMIFNSGLLVHTNYLVKSIISITYSGSNEVHDDVGYCMWMTMGLEPFLHTHWSNLISHGAIVNS
jgi:hypothetical protein